MASRCKSGNKARPGELSRLIARLTAAVRDQIPAGYENETGFNYGTERQHHPLSDRQKSKTTR